MPKRERLPDTRDSVVHKFSLSGHEGYINVGFYEDGRPGELFLTMAKEGSTIAGLMDTIGILTSLSLQYGVPLHAIADKLKGTKFEPNEPGKASSIPDYVFRWMEEYVSSQEYNEEGPLLSEASELALDYIIESGEHLADQLVPTPLEDFTELLHQDDEAQAPTT